MIKEVTIYSDPDNPTCARVEKFLSELEIKLKVHDIKAQPLNYNQISNLLQHFQIDHFYNSNGFSQKTTKDKAEPIQLDRNEVIEKMAANNKSIRLPIIATNRLMTVGDNLDTIKIMLQIKSNGSDPNEQDE